MQDTIAAPSGGLERAADPHVREITVDDISAALTAGIRDFKAAPQFGLSVAAFYVAGGLLMTWAVARADMLFLAYPLAAGFALVAPLLAIRLYEVSRLMETGITPSWGHVLSKIPGHTRREIGYMALVATFGLIGWVYVAGFLYALFFGLHPFSFDEFLGVALATPRGVLFFFVGNIVGAVIATVLFALSVVSYPMLLDRDVDFVTAIIASIRAVVASPGPMIGWGIFIASMLVIAMLPLFMGLFVILPVLGHATWHLYRRVVEPAA